MCADCEILDRVYADKPLDARFDQDSPEYRGLVLARAVLILRDRLRARTLADLSRQIDVCCRTLRYWMDGRATSKAKFATAFFEIEELAKWKAESSARSMRA
jgi:hypothetical protein